TRIHDLAEPLPPAMTSAFWLGNIGGVTTVIFLVVRYAYTRNTLMLKEVREQRLATERAMAKVAEQSEQLKELGLLGDLGHRSLGGEALLADLLEHQGVARVRVAHHEEDHGRDTADVAEPERRGHGRRQRLREVVDAR